MRTFNDYLEDTDPELAENLRGMLGAGILGASLMTGIGCNNGKNCDTPMQAVQKSAVQKSDIKQLDKNTYEIEGRAAIPQSLGFPRGKIVAQERAMIDAKRKVANKFGNAISTEFIDGGVVGDEYVVKIKIILLPNGKNRLEIDDD